MSESEKHECCDCGSTEDVSFDSNPYEEVNGDYTKVWMCNECRRQSVQYI